MFLKVIYEDRMRRCARCGLLKTADNFGLKDQRRGTRKSYCRPCARDYGRRHYRQNRTAYVRRARARTVRERAVVQQKVAEYLTGRRCVDCGERDIVVLEFDHRDGEKKRANVARLVLSGSWEAVALEIEKCDVRCVNCHRLRTARQFRWTAKLAGMNRVGYEGTVDIS
jgi:hypothetical protein